MNAQELVNAKINSMRDERKTPMSMRLSTVVEPTQASYDSCMDVTVDRVHALVNELEALTLTLFGATPDRVENFPQSSGEGVLLRSRRCMIDIQQSCLRGEELIKLIRSAL